MRTKNMKKPDLILGADIHRKDNVPVCRTDDFAKTQDQKLLYIRHLQQKYQCPVLFAGDIFDRWKPSPNLIARTMLYMPDDCIAIAGQHDLSGHNLKEIINSGLYVLEIAESVSLLYGHSNVMVANDFSIHGFNFGEELHSVSETKATFNVALVHTLAYHKEKPYPGAPSSGNVKSILKKLKGFDLIVTGDNHQPFTYKSKSGQLLVNPGSLCRITAGQINHKPRVYLYYKDTHTVEPHYIPIDKKAIRRDHIDLENARNKKIDEFATKLKNDIDLDLSFEKNMKEFNEANKTEKDIQEKIAEAMGE